MSKKADVITHISVEGLGNLQNVLAELDFSIDYYQAGIDDFKALSHSTADLLVILGGPIGVYEHDDYPFILDEIQLIQHRHQKKMPMLGICLGAQLMARALGAQVYPGHAAELGWHPISVNKNAKDNPLREFDQTQVVHWHSDTFDCPPGAECLASSSKYTNQAFRVGQHLLALQFHPEITADNMTRWLIAHVAEIKQTPDVSVASLRADTEQYVAEMQQKSAKLWQSWLQSACC